MAVTDEAIVRIKEMILTGEIGPGDKLPPEKELSQRLGLSRNSMREAVKALEVIRVLDVRRGDGTYVTSLEPALLLEAMSFIVELHGDSSVLEVFAVRRILESAAVGIAATRITDDAIAALTAELASVDDSTGVDALLRHDLRFHAAVVAAAGNAYLSSIVDSLSSQTVRARIWRGLTQENAVARTLLEHGAILDALERRDAELAQSLTVAHIAGIEQWLQDAAALPSAAAEVPH